MISTSDLNENGADEEDEDGGYTSSGSGARSHQTATGVATESKLGMAAALERLGVRSEAEVAPRVAQGEIVSTSPNQRLRRVGIRVTPDGASFRSEMEVNVDGRLRRVASDGSEELTWGNRRPLFRRTGEPVEPRPPRFPQEESATGLAYFASAPGAGDALEGSVSVEQLGEGFVRRQTAVDVGAGTRRTQVYYFDGSEYEVIR